MSAAHGLHGQSILSVNQFDRDALGAVFAVAREMAAMVARQGASKLLEGRVLANLFYEPSTRTASSFIAAMQRLGGSVIPINEVHYSSVAKGESLPDTVRTLECYADLIVLRHPEVGSAALAARYARKPIVNAGDGTGEHPTQALLDLHTIREELGRLEGLRVTLVGDLRHGRTVHSLARLLSRFEVELRYVAPEPLRMPPALVAELRERGVAQSEHDSLDEVLASSDVVYVTRVQKERFEDPDAYARLAGSYVVTAETLARAPASMVLMHPLPRVGEIALEVDRDPRAAYFRQVEYGMHVRMALLAMVLGRA